jgi:hypothetical protein
VSWPWIWWMISFVPLVRKRTCPHQSASKFSCIWNRYRRSGRSNHWIGPTGVLTTHVQLHTPPHAICTSHPHSPKLGCQQDDSSEPWHCVFCYSGDPLFDLQSVYIRVWLCLLDQAQQWPAHPSSTLLFPGKQLWCAGIGIYIYWTSTLAYYPTPQKKQP